MKILLLFACLMSLSVWADEADDLAKEVEVSAEKKAELAAKIEDDGSFNSRKAHWVTTFAGQHVRYRLPLQRAGFPNKTFNHSKDWLYGPSLGFGREVYVPGGFLVGGRIDGYYLATAFNETTTAQPNIAIKYAGAKHNAAMYGGEAVGHFGWMMDFKGHNPIMDEDSYLALELFGEAGVGGGNTSTHAHYYDKSSSPSQYYDMTARERFISHTVTAGLNLLSTTSGFFLTLRGTRFDQASVHLNQHGYEGPKSSRTTFSSSSSTKRDPIFIYTLGGGYKF